MTQKNNLFQYLPFFSKKSFEKELNPDREQQILNLLKDFGVDCQSVQNTEASLEEAHLQLQKSFQTLRNKNDLLLYEITLLKEAEKLEIPSSEYRRLYELWIRTKNPANKFWHVSKLNSMWNWFGEGKKPWDFVQLLATISIPILLTIGTTYFTADRARQETLNKYFEFMAGLLTEKKQQGDSQDVVDKSSDIRVWSTARARTLAALRDLDDPRKMQLLSFLKDAGLVDRDKPNIKLEQADLSRTNLNSIDLSDTNLNLVNFNSADLSKANLSNTNLGEANLIGTNLTGTDLRGANLLRAQLQSPLSTSAILCGTTLPTGEISDRNCRELFTTAYVETLTESGLNVRSGPGLKYSVIGGVPDGGVIIYLNKKIIYSDGLAWAQLSSGGWIAIDKLK